MKPFVAKLVKSFGRLGNAAESLDDFRYAKARFKQEKIAHGVGWSSGTRVNHWLARRAQFSDCHCYLLLAFQTGENGCDGSTSSLTARTSMIKDGPSAGNCCTSEPNARTASRK